MNKLQKWFLAIAGLLALGIPFLFIGLQLPDAMDTAVLTEAAEYVILDRDFEGHWAEIPGKTKFNDTKTYFLFNCKNPEEVATRGVDPEYEEVGPFVYEYEHKLDETSYIDSDEVKNAQVTFIKKFNHRYLGIIENLEKEYRVINLSGMKRWESAKNKEPFQLAIEGFFETFLFSRMNFIRDLSNRKLSVYYNNIDHINELTEGLNDIKIDVRGALGSDPYYGLQKPHNVYDWTLMCDGRNDKVAHEVYTYFGFSINSFMEVKNRFCNQHIDFSHNISMELCGKISSVVCSDYNISFHQWMYGNLTNNESYSNITHKKLFGIYEFSLYREKFMQMLRPVYKRQFENVKWDDKYYIHLLDSYYEYPDYKTDEASLLLYDNMRQLYRAGRATPDPFRKSSVGSYIEESDSEESLDLARFESIARVLKVSKEQAFMLYSYFDYYVKNTILMQDIGGTLEKERIGNYGAFVLKDIADYCEDFLDVVLYTRSLSKQIVKGNCIETAKALFTVDENKDIINEIAGALCDNHIFNTNLSEPVGLKHFVETSSYPYGYSYSLLDKYLTSKVKSYESLMLDSMIYGSKSLFWRALDNIKKEVKKHYQSVSGKKACMNTFSPYCTKRQFFFTQFEESYITRFPYSEVNMTKTDYISDWRKIIKKYIEPKIIFRQHGVIDQLPDQPIEVPVELPYLKRYYGGNNINRDDLYSCMNFIELYDTDVLFNIFLNINTPGRLSSCRKFATVFFYNSTRYLIRNVQFGPMYSWTTPEAAFFGYFNELLHLEHELVDYLEGDDCTVDPWIGYNPKKTQVEARANPFDYQTWRTTMHTGAKSNTDIRKYALYYENKDVFHRKLVRDKSGDKCTYMNASPFSEGIRVDYITDGMQYPQYPGRTPKGDTKYIMESNVYRPMKAQRRNDYYYEYESLEVDTYLIEFKSDILCPNGISFINSIDMTSFYQYRGIISAPQFGNISEPGLNKPKVEFSNFLDRTTAPYGYKKYESYYKIEPYTGMTMQYVKSFMSSLVLYYDDLYLSPKRGGRKELIPYYSLYENASVSPDFAMHMKSTILSSVTARTAVRLTFSILGAIFVLIGLLMILLSCAANPEEFFGGIPDNKIPEATTLEVKPIVMERKASLNLSEGEDLQQELDPMPAKVSPPELNQQEPAQNQIVVESAKKEVPEPEVIQPEVTQPEVVQSENIIQPEIVPPEVKELEENLLS